MRIAALIPALSMVIVPALAGCSRAPSQQASTARAPTPRATPAPAIPVALQGRFARKPADCDPAHGGNVLGLLTIGASEIALGLDPMPVERVIVRPDRIAFDTTATARGESEARQYVFNVSPDKRRLTRTGAGPTDLVYTRCPNPPS